MKFGLGLSVQHAPDDSQPRRFEEHLEQVRLASAVGFDSVWASQHYVSAPFTYFQPMPVLSRVAPEAGTMSLGTGVLLLPLHHPVDVAEQIATLDMICGGRFIFGVGLGYRDAENRALAVPSRDRVGRLTEALEVIERLWTGEPVSYAGRHFTLDNVRISMPTLQRPRPPIWLAANADVGVERAARVGDAWRMNQHATFETLERQLALFRRARSAAGKPAAAEIPLIKECYVAPDRATAVSEARPHLGSKYEAYRQWEQDKALPPGESFASDFEALARDRFLLGDPARIREEITRYRERLGVTTLIVRVQWPGMEQAKVLRSIRLLGEEVFPHLR